MHPKKCLRIWKIIHSSEKMFAHLEKCSRFWKNACATLELGWSRNYETS
jgi:hypothetical protein